MSSSAELIELLLAKTENDEVQWREHIALGAGDPFGLSRVFVRPVIYRTEAHEIAVQLAVRSRLQRIAGTGDLEVTLRVRNVATGTEIEVPGVPSGDVTTKELSRRLTALAEAVAGNIQRQARKDDADAAEMVNALRGG